VRRCCSSRSAYAHRRSTDFAPAGQLYPPGFAGSAHKQQDPVTPERHTRVTNHAEDANLQTKVNVAQVNVLTDDCANRLQLPVLTDDR
jgi:hypothetical protein